MRPLVLTDDLKFGVTVIDSQHHRMVEIVNDLLATVLERTLGAAEDRLLDELVRLAKLNFRSEEAWMRSCGYERYDVHAESHAHLLDELVELRAGMATRHEHLNRKLVLFVRRWLENHLVHSDRDLAEAIRVRVKADAKAGPEPRKRSGSGAK